MSAGPVQFQYDVPDIDNSTGARIEFVTLYNGSGADLAAGDPVALDLATVTEANGKSLALGMAVKKSTTAAPQAVIGAAHVAIPTGKWGQVQVRGPDDDVKLEGTVVALDVLVGSPDTAGRLKTQSATYAATTLPVAICLVAPTSNVGSVLWLGNRGYGQYR
jgi:hypothetical protein